MKVVILAGGLGTRISEYTKIIPKPMIRVNKKPIIYFIMKHYANYGFKDFYIALGYKGHIIKKYFEKSNFGWNINLIDTGQETMTGGRLKRLKKYLRDEPFMLTYGDGVADIDIEKLIKFHKSHGKAITITSSQQEGRFGALNIDKNSQVYEFREKPKSNNSWINGGFFICESKVFDYIDDNYATVFEHEPLMNLAKDGELFTFKHGGFWKPMDTLRDKEILEDALKKNSI